MLNDSNQSGYLISFEGGEGGGKTTQIELLKDKLVGMGKDVLVLREPGGTSISEQIRQVVLSSKNTDMAFTTEVLLFQAARAQLYHEVIAPALQDGKVVLMDRSRDSSVVYQGMVRGFGKEFIERLNDISTNNTYPNLTLLLDLDVDTGLQRRRDSGEMDRIDMEDHSFHEKVRQAYIDLASDDESGRWHHVDASGSIDDVFNLVWQLVQAKMNLS
jgi:dTMP kinase